MKTICITGRAPVTFKSAFEKMFPKVMKFTLDLVGYLAGYWLQQMKKTTYDSLVKMLLGISIPVPSVQYRYVYCWSQQLCISVHFPLTTMLPTVYIVNIAIG